jgi:glycosyltransferase involved in cell wall biosynthesis
MKIVVTVPAFNEEATIGRVIRDIKDVMSKQKHTYKVLVVDDGSTDRTASVAKKAGATVFSHPYNSGLSETFRTEMKKCLELGAEVIIHTDADGQYLASEIPKLLKPIENREADLVLGSRFMGKIEKMPAIKRLGNRAFSKVISGIIGRKVTDCQTGFRAFTSDVAKDLEIISDHTYTQEQIIKAVKHKFRIREVPIHFRKRVSGKSRLLSNPFEYAVKAWINIFRIYRDYNPLKFFGVIGGALTSIGVLIGIYILYLFFTEGALGTFQKLPTILLGILLFITGIQILVFGFLADGLKR